MQDGGGEAAAPPPNVGPAKRTRRPSVRLHQPYYENPGHRKVQRQWKGAEKSFRGAKRPRTVRTVDSKSKDGKNDGDVGEEGEGMEDLDFDDDVAIVNWKNFSAAKKDVNLESKKVRSSNSTKRLSGKSGDEDLETEKLSWSSGAKSGEHGQREKKGEQEEEEQEEQGEEENLDNNGTNHNLAIENVDRYSPYCSFGNDDENDKLSDDGNDLGEKGRGLSNDRHSNGMGGKARTREGEVDRHGVKMWLNKLGLSKYATLLEVHGVDDEVLPFLTLEDLKDMGINEVGSRRKMYSSIQKLSKGLP